MNPVKQAEEMVQSWSEVQQKMWDRWQEMLRGAATEASPGSEGSDSVLEAWRLQSRQVLEAWDGSVRRALEAQLEWTRIWAERVGEAENMPPQLTAAAGQLHDAAKSWTGLQTQLWEGWMRAATRPATATPGLQALQDAARVVAEAQAEWARQWMGRTNAREPRTRSGTKSASESSRAGGSAATGRRRGGARS